MRLSQPFLVVGRAQLDAVPKAARPALLAAWQAGPLLELAAKEPARVAEGQLQISEFRRRARLMRAALTGRI